MTGELYTICEASIKLLDLPPGDNGANGGRTACTIERLCKGRSDLVTIMHYADQRQLLRTLKGNQVSKGRFIWHDGDHWQ